MALSCAPPTPAVARSCATRSALAATARRREGDGGFGGSVHRQTVPVELALGESLGPAQHAEGAEVFQ